MKKLDLVKCKKNATRIYHKWSIHLLLTTVAILLLMILSNKTGLLAGVTLFNNTPIPTDILTSSPTPSLSPNPEIIPTPVVVYKESDPVHTNVPVQTSVPTQVAKVDSATHIELCKTKASRHKTQVETALVLDFNQKNPAIIELSNASNIYETKIIAIKYGMINEGDLEANFTVVSNYLTNIHDWAVKQISDYMAIVNGKGSIAYNDFYAKCLNNEN